MSWALAHMFGYEPISTFWDDFTYAEQSGVNKIKEMAASLFEDWKDDYKFLTELIMVINHKSWYWNDYNNDEYTKLYSDLYYEYDDKAITYLESKQDQEALNYYFRTLD